MEERALNPEIVVSGDGSHTLKMQHFDEHYHSHKGAIQESRHVFINMGLNPKTHLDSIRILEVGFGTGLNALLTAVNEPTTNIHYTALEAFPLPAVLTNKLNYPTLLDHKEALNLFNQIHEAEWNKPIAINPHFTLEKHEVGFEAFATQERFDLIYYDAFAPNVQPELWQPSIWEKLHGLMAAGGVLVTYCAKGQVRRDMQAAGFSTERLPGPPGKNEMLRVTKTL